MGVRVGKEVWKEQARMVQGVWKQRDRNVQGWNKSTAMSVEDSCNECEERARSVQERCRMWARREFTELVAQG